MAIRDLEKRLRVQIEKKRREMYKAFENNVAYDELMEVSQELDHLLNQLAAFNQSVRIKK